MESNIPRLPVLPKPPELRVTKEGVSSGTRYEILALCLFFVAYAGLPALAIFKKLQELIGSWI